MGGGSWGNVNAEKVGISTSANGPNSRREDGFGEAKTAVSPGPKVWKGGVHI